MIAVATLLVAVVGATFAYFTATNSGTPTETKTEITTAKVAGTTFTFGPEDGVVADDNNFLDYPGGYAVFAANAKATKGEGDTNEYDLSYKLKLTYTNETTTDLTWILYRSDSTLKNSLTSTCKLVQEDKGSGTINYYYTDTGESTGSDCSGPSLSSQIATGTLTAGQSTKDITSTDVGDLGSQTISTSNDEDGIFYYVVVKYENKKDQSATEGNQNDDMNKKINVSLTVDGEVSTKVATD